MKLFSVSVLLVLSAILGCQGYIYTKFDGCLQKSENAFYAKEYGGALAVIDSFQQNRWCKLIKKYPRLDFFELNKTLDYQRGRIEAELGNFKKAYGLSDECASAQNTELAFRCLYQQGNIAFYQGNPIAEKKWQSALEKNSGGHDFDTQVNLELLKKENNKARSLADAAMLTHRRSGDPYFYLRPPTQKDQSVRP